jgi:hypothetical protein
MENKADMTSPRHRYAQAAFALEELILLVPHNSFFVLQYAEVLATMNDLDGAYKQYLRVLELCGNEQANEGKSNRHGPLVRALWGLKTITGRLLSTPSNTQIQSKAKGNVAAVGSALNGNKAESVEAIDALITDLLLNRAYVGQGAGVKASRDAARKVLEQSQ